MSRNRRFSVGDHVRIREWDDMVNEFGVTNSGYIPCKLTFTRNMKHLCGREFVITRIGTSPMYVEGLQTTYAISMDMIELVSDSSQDDDSFVADDFISILKGV